MQLVSLIKNTFSFTNMDSSHYFLGGDKKEKCGKVCAYTFSKPLNIQLT